MKIKNSAIAGTLESSDCMVTIEPVEKGAGITFELDSTVIRQFGNQIRKVTYQTLEELDIEDLKISIVDKGALDCTIRARIEGAVYRALGKKQNIPWGGMN